MNVIRKDEEGKKPYLLIFKNTMYPKVIDLYIIICI